LWAEWELGGDATDPGTVAVTVFSDRLGAPIMTAAPTTGTGSSRSVSLTAAQTANLDLLTFTWTAADGSVLTTYAEVVGGFLFSLARARKLSPLQDTAAYTTDAILEARTLAEAALEDICGVSFVPRYSREEVSIEGYGLLRGSRRRIRNVVQLTTFMSTSTGGSQQPLPTLSGLQIVNGTDVYMPMLLNWFSRPIMMAYEHGYPFTPPRVGNAVLLLARRWCIESPWDERTTGFRTRDGGEMSILTASHSDPFDLPEVVAIADAYGFPLVA
jgi:hypothetical protein